MLALVLSLAVPAQGWLGKETKRGDLDGDGAAETASSQRVDLKGVARAFDRTVVAVADTCDGRRVRRRIAGPQDNLALMRLKDTDRRPGREVFVELRSGASARAGEARVVAWRDCAPRNLFRYLTERPTGRPRGATGDVASFFVSVREISPRRPGLEIALDERFLRKSDPPSFGTFKKVTWWRYDGGRDRYVRYRSKVRRISLPR